MDDLNLDQLMDEARADLAFDETNVVRVSLLVPLLTEKYARKLVFAKAALKKAEIDMNQARQERMEYFTREHPTRVDRRDMDTYIQGDPKYTKFSAPFEIRKLQVEYIETILGALDRASWNIGNAIKMMIHKNGGDH